MLVQILATDPDWISTVARMILGIIFVAHGSQKVFGWFGGPGLKKTLSTLTESVGLPRIVAVAAVGAEFLGGLALILGLLARISALGIAVSMLAAILMVHGKYGLFMNWFGDRKGHGIEYHLLAIALAIVIIANGAGAFSHRRSAIDVDRRVTRSSRQRTGATLRLAVVQIIGQAKSSQFAAQAYDFSRVSCAASS